MRAFTIRVRHTYGANPLHLLALLTCFAFVGYVISTLGASQLWHSHKWCQSIIVWFVGAIVLHDFVLFPFYAIADRSLGAGWRAITGRVSVNRPRVLPVNYIRIPVLASGLLFLVFFPGIIEQGRPTYLRATGLTQQPFLDRYLFITAVLFGASAIAYAIRSLLARRVPQVRE
jgi:hypothetical protein